MAPRDGIALILAGMVKVERKGSVNNDVSAEYKYDKADNRTNVNVVSPNTTPKQ